MVILVQLGDFWVACFRTTPLVYKLPNSGCELITDHSSCRSKCESRNMSVVFEQIPDQLVGTHQLDESSQFVNPRTLKHKHGSTFPSACVRGLGELPA